MYALSPLLEACKTSSKAQSYWSGFTDDEMQYKEVCVRDQ